MVRFCLFLLVQSAIAENNGLAITPPMGWNPWNCYGNRGDGVTEEVVISAGRAMKEKLAPFGYQYINLDCGYSALFRDASGNMLINATRFPHGMKWLGDQIHSLGLKFGMYGALGYAQCCSGTANHNATDGSGPGCNKGKTTCRNETYYDVDAKQWASWGVDLLKFDGCGGPFESVGLMRAALNATGRPIVYSVHSKVDKGEMDTNLANYWRVGSDIGASYEQFIDRAMISNNVTVYLPGGPGGWNDPDMLQIGNINMEAPKHGIPPPLFPEAEGRTQFALWCIMKSPLLIGTFLHNISDTTLATVTNKAAIGVNQDPLGEQGILRKDGGYMPDQPRPTRNKAFGFQIWSGSLSSGGAAAVLANLEGNKSQPLTLTNNEMPRSRQATAKWDIVEAFSGVKQTGVTLPATVMVDPHDVAMWVMTPASE